MIKSKRGKKKFIEKMSLLQLATMLHATDLLNFQIDLQLISNAVFPHQSN